MSLALPQLHFLIHFHGGYNRWDDRCCSGILDGLRALPSLQSIILDGNTFHELSLTTLHHIFECHQLGTLKSLSLHQSSLTDGHGSHLFQSISISHIETLDISSNHLGRLTATTFQKLSSRPQSLKWLNTSSNEFGRAGGILLFQGLSRSPNIEYINLAFCAFSSPALMTAIIRCINANRVIKRINLCNNRFTEGEYQMLFTSIATVYGGMNHTTTDPTKATPKAVIDHPMEAIYFAGNCVSNDRIEIDNLAMGKDFKVWMNMFHEHEL